MMHNEARERLVEGYERTQNAAMTAEAYGVSERQVYKLAKQKRETGSVALRTSQRWRENIAELPKTKLVFPDESEVNTNMARRYGRATGKQRMAGAVPLNTPKTTTVLSAMRQDGQFACRTFIAGRQKTAFWNIYGRSCCPA